MLKRKHPKGLAQEKPAKKDQIPFGLERDDDEGSDDEDLNNIDVEFEWFDPNPQVDFHGLNTLIRQSFDVDAPLFQVSALTDLILSQPLLGSTVKVDGQEADPWAFLSVLNLQEHREKQVIRDLISYFILKSQSIPSLRKLADFFDGSSSCQVGLILTDRLINIPIEVVPPMYKMIIEEITWACEESEPYSFTHYLVLSKTYTEVASALDEGSAPPKKKKKGSGEKDNEEVFYFHPEDEYFQRFSIGHGNFTYTKESEGGPDSKRAFQELGVKPQGHLILFEAKSFETAVSQFEDFIKA
ncbi:MAG: Mss4p nuclear export [Trizodia sp. TS-e1964]|nr:MAG: Mss4p nuclear export [Trizodia sp. TS-e1964]